MVDNVVYLSGEEPEPVGEPRPDIAEMLKFVTERAMRGELVNCVIVAIDDKGSSMRGFSTPENESLALLGSLELIKKEIMERVFSGGARTLWDADR